MTQLADLPPGMSFMLVRTRQKFITHGIHPEKKYRVMVTPVGDTVVVSNMLHISCEVKPVVRGEIGCD